MRRCIISRLSARPAGSDDAHHGRRGNDIVEVEVNEKRVAKPRNWSLIFLSAIRFLQLAYFSFAYSALFGFQRSSYFREDAPWQRSPDQMHRSNQTMRWVRTEVCEQ